MTNDAPLVIHVRICVFIVLVLHTFECCMYTHIWERVEGLSGDIEPRFSVCSGHPFLYWHNILGFQVRKHFQVLSITGKWEWRVIPRQEQIYRE